MGPAGNILTTRKLIAMKFVTLQYFLIGTKMFTCIFSHYIRYTCSNAADLLGFYITISVVYRMVTKKRKYPLSGKFAFLMRSEEYGQAAFNSG